MFKRMRIQTQLFIVYSLLIVLTTTIVSVRFYGYVRNSLEQSAYESLWQIASRVSSQIDMQLQKLDSLTTKVIFSEAIKEAYFDRLNAPEGVKLPSNLHSFNDAIYAIIGPMELNWQVNIFNTDGVLVSAGNTSQMCIIDPALLDQSWIRDTYSADGSLVVSMPHANCWGYGEEQVISLARCFGRTFISQKNAVVEAQIGYDDLSESISQWLKDSESAYMENLRMVLLDEQEGVLFAYGQDPQPLVERYTTTCPNEREMATMLLFLDMPIPAAFMRFLPLYELATDAVIRFDCRSAVLEFSI